MKRCPTCGQTYDDTQSFCANDGSRLEADEPAAPAYDPMATIMAPPPSSTGDIKPPQTFTESTPQQSSPPSWSAPSEPLAPSGSAGPGGWAPPPPPSLSGGGQQNTLAIVSLILGVLSILCLGILTGLPAIVLGFMHLNKIKADPATYGGKGLAIAGMGTGAVGTLLSILGIIIWILLIVSGGRF